MHEMRHEKTWLVVGELTDKDISWLYQSQYEIDVNRKEIHFTMMTGSHSRVTMPDVTEITIKTYNNKKETMLLLRFGDKLCLLAEQFYSVDHGCYINFQ
jgi:hypothetical protein